MKIKVGPVLYEVLFVEKLRNDEGQELFGQADHGPSLIRLNTTNTDSQNFLTLWHEVVHCIENVYGVQLSEEGTIQLSTGIALALLDNPVLRGDYGAHP
jgi:hypothetical protein